MNRHDFDILLQKYLNGECNREESEQIERWSESMLHHSHVVFEASEEKSVRRRLWKKLKKTSLYPGGPRVMWWRAGIAAMLAVAIGLTYLYGPVFRGSPDLNSYSSNRHGNGISLENEALDFVTIVSTEAGRSHLLEDGTRVRLHKGSRLRYPVHFGKNQRKVELTGEAFFEVKKDAARPFFVLTGDLITQVLGTSFNVSSYANSGSIVVSVVSGRVSVYENMPEGTVQKNGVILTPNQQITFDRASKKLVPELVKDPQMVNPPAKEQSFMFREVPLSDVLKAVQHAFNVEIVLESPMLQNCIFTGDLNDLSLHTQLLFICSAVNGTYELRGTTFFIRGEGCP